MKIRVSSDITFDSIVDGPGLRMVIWTQGCMHNCIGCHNPQTHSLCGGYEVDTKDIINTIKDLKLQRDYIIRRRAIFTSRSFRRDS